MIATPQKEIAQLQRTLANELPQELSNISEYGLPDVQSGSREKVRRPKKSVVVRKRGTQTDKTCTNYTDDGHPTILATSGLIRSS